jgi:hypothetical protein
VKNWGDVWPNKTPWTHAQVARLRELRGKGASFPRIAREVGHTAGACQSKAVQLGVRAPRSTAVQKCIPTMQKSGAARNAQHWTKEEEQRLLALVTHRLSYAEIGAKLNRTAVAVELRHKLLSRGVADSKKREGQRRPCLNCRQPFNSEGPHNRLCKNCRGISVSPFEL